MGCNITRDRAGRNFNVGIGCCRHCGLDGDLLSGGLCLWYDNNCDSAGDLSNDRHLGLNGGGGTWNLVRRNANCSILAGACRRWTRCGQGLNAKREKKEERLDSNHIQSQKNKQKKSGN
ncbi:unnamed protein product [Fusarium graminearum]|nr:unnamed protein product [Fusarium graminearum]